MKILITGAAGFVGSNLLNSLIESGYDATGVDNLSFGYKKNVEKQERLIIKAFEELTEDYVNQYDILVHMACANIIYSQLNPIDTFKVNAHKTIELFEKFKGSIIYTSTASVYGQADEIPTKEDAPIQTYNAYDQSKYIAELYLKLRGNYATLRLSNVYGKNQRPDNPYSGVISKFIESAGKRQNYKVYGDGTDTRDFTYIDDVVSAIGNVIVRMMKGETIDDTFNISTGKENSILKVASEINRLFFDGDIQLEFIPKRSIDGIQRRALDNTKAAERLSWKPRTSLTDGLYKTINWMKSEKIIDTNENNL